LPAILELVGRVRMHTNVPIVLMGYYNPIFHGPTRFARDAAAAGVDGLLLVDLPPEEADEIHGDLRAAGVRLITLLAPTTPLERMARLAAAGEGFIYYVSMTGVTGTSQVDAGAIEAAVRSLRELSPVPVAVGFGISSAADAAAVGSFADAVVVGSALVKVVAAYGSSPELPAQAGAFIRALKQSLQPGGLIGISGGSFVSSPPLDAGPDAAGTDHPRSGCSSGKDFHIKPRNRAETVAGPNARDAGSLCTAGETFPAEGRSREKTR
jgi:tryptophan synthase alpha chain